MKESPNDNPDTRSVTPAFNPDPDRCQEYDYLDVGDRLLSEDGRIAPEMTSDFFHPAEKGYDVLGQAIEPTLAKLLEP